MSDCWGTTARANPQSSGAIRRRDLISRLYRGVRICHSGRWYCILEVGTMPLYEYRCKTCGNTFEKLRRMSDSDRDVECPDCKSPETERQLSTFAAGGCSPSGRFT